MSLSVCPSVSQSVSQSVREIEVEHAHRAGSLVLTSTSKECVPASGRRYSIGADHSALHEDPPQRQCTWPSDRHHGTVRSYRSHQCNSRPSQQLVDDVSATSWDSQGLEESLHPFGGSMPRIPGQ